MDIWALKWSELLQIRTGRNMNQGSYKGDALATTTGSHDQLEKNVPINEVARAAHLRQRLQLSKARASITTNSRPIR